MSLKVLAQASAICCLALLASHSVRAQGAPAGSTGGAGDPMAIYRQAGVSQEQEMRIRQLAKDFEDQARVKAKRMMGLMQEMHQLSLEADPDEKAVLGKQDEINQVTADMSNDRIKLLLTIRKQLTDAQKQKLVGMMKEASGGGGGGGQPAAQ